jgi:hypothetical protein
MSAPQPEENTSNEYSEFEPQAKETLEEEVKVSFEFLFTHITFELLLAKIVEFHRIPLNNYAAVYM